MVLYNGAQQEPNEMTRSIKELILTFKLCIYLWASSYSVVHILITIKARKSGDRFMKLYVSDFHRQMLEATEILASYWLRASMSVLIID